MVASTEWTDGAAGRVDSTVKITYTNGASWYLRVTELSERNHSREELERYLRGAIRAALTIPEVGT